MEQSNSFCLTKKVVPKQEWEFLKSYNDPYSAFEILDTSNVQKYLQSIINEVFA